MGRLWEGGGGNWSNHIGVEDRMKGESTGTDGWNWGAFGDHAAVEASRIL